MQRLKHVYIKFKVTLSWLCYFLQVVPGAGQSEYSQGICAHLVPPSEDQALPDPAGQ